MKGKGRPRFNPVAKHAPKFNKGGVHRDKTKYTRKGKHNTLGKANILGGTKRCRMTLTM